MHWPSQKAVKLLYVTFAKLSNSKDHLTLVQVIELKCTQQNRSEHKENYRTPCQNQRILHKSGLLNNEFNAHQWQVISNPMLIPSEDL